MSAARWGLAALASGVAHAGLFAGLALAIAPAPPPAPPDADAAAFDLLSYPVPQSRATPETPEGEAAPEAEAESRRTGGGAIPQSRAAAAPLSADPLASAAPRSQAVGERPAEGLPLAATPRPGEAVRPAPPGGQRPVDVVPTGQAAAPVEAATARPAEMVPDSQSAREASPVAARPEATRPDAEPVAPAEAPTDRPAAVAFAAQAMEAARAPALRPPSLTPEAARLAGQSVPDAASLAAVAAPTQALGAVTAGAGRVAARVPAAATPRDLSDGVGEPTASVSPQAPRLRGSAAVGVQAAALSETGETVDATPAPALRLDAGETAVGVASAQSPAATMAAVVEPRGEALRGAGAPGEVVLAVAAPAQSAPTAVVPAALALNAGVQPAPTAPAAAPDTTRVAPDAPAMAPVSATDTTGAPVGATATDGVAQAIAGLAIPADRQAAALAWSGDQDAAVDPLSLAAIQSFTVPGDPDPDAGPPVRDRIGALLASVPCARLQTAFDPDTGALTLRGHIPEEALRAPVLEALGAQVGPSIPLRDTVLILPRPVCGALAGISAVGLAQSDDQEGDPRVVGQAAHTALRRFAEGERLSFALLGPDYPAYYYIDYFDAAGNVIHLQPNESVPLRAIAPEGRAEIGSGADGQPALALYAAPPFGQEILAAFASSVPLYEGVRPLVEPAAPYLAYLQDRVAAARAAAPDFKGEWFYIFVQTGS